MGLDRYGSLSVNMLLNIKVLLLTKVLLSYSKIQAVQLAVHGNKLAVHCTALPQCSAATASPPLVRNRRTHHNPLPFTSFQFSYLYADLK